MIGSEFSKNLQPREKAREEVRGGMIAGRGNVGQLVRAAHSRQLISIPLRRNADERRTVYR